MDLSRVVAGDGPHPLLVLSLVEELGPDSHSRALRAGCEGFRGWGVTQSLLADLFDAVNANTAATGNFKHRPKIAPWPRPKVSRRRSGRPVTLEEVRAGLFG